jgi:amino acid transporter
MKLNRRFSPASLLMLSINGMLGSAWLFAPLYAAKIAGTGSIVAWIIGGIATAIIALTFAELSALLPVAGGTAQIPQLSHGTFTSFTLSWLAWLSALTMAPIEVQAVLQYASTYFPTLTYIANGIPTLTNLGMLWATILMIGLCIVNVASFKGLVRFNFILFLFKVVVIILAVVYLVKASFHTSNFNDITSVYSIQGWQAILTAVATGGIAFAFTGFKHGVELAGETTKLKIAIPLAIVGSVLCCMLLYIGLQVAFIGALDSSLLVNGWSQVNFSGDVGPFAGLAAGLGLFWLLKLLYFDAVISPLGAGLIYVTSTARILYAMSEIGFVPKFLSKLNKQGLPIAAVMTNFIIGMCLFLPLPNWQSMVGFLVSGMVLSYAMGPVALLCLRLDLPDEQRVFRLPMPKLICALAFYFCTMISYWTGWDTMYKLGISILIGMVLFVVAYLRGKLKDQVLWFRSAIWVVPYISGLILVSYLGAFGGKNVIAFGWDFIVLGVFSVGILYLAVISRHNEIKITFANFLSQGTLTTKSVL